MSNAEKATTALLELMVRLRDPQEGCPWDQVQTFASIAPYTIEEAYEVADAIESGRPEKIRDELGDLLFQVVFHARMAEERGWFDFAAVAGSIHDKLVRRHPHVFADAVIGGAGQVKGHEKGHENRSWEALKAQERAEAALRGDSAQSGALGDVPKSLPALVRAAKLGRRAGRVGFDWANAAQVREKVLEELAEVDAEVAVHDAARVEEELGDLLFAVTNWGRHLQVDAEEALRGANRKFETRFRKMEALAAEAGLALESLSPTQWEALWESAKRQTGAPVS